ncbi:hypothetical protein [Pseudomonas mosselii]|uniref:hypothetical protein n=1 Tax=Pseudomonas mosselii TaxID=78327 RepID=UPI0011B651A3|nr:hypothetical protein [Pseudomonas mosselii]
MKSYFCGQFTLNKKASIHYCASLVKQRSTIALLINWIAHNWNPLNSHWQYNTCIQGLEKMLSWSFANDRCLLDWTREDFEEYSTFILNPSRVPLPPAFVQAFDSYLTYLNIDANQLLPASYLFECERPRPFLAESFFNLWNA